MKTDPTGITTAASDLLATAVALGPIVLLAGLAVVAFWGWATRGRGY